ncbi:glycosyltransferase [Cecembia lonarensis]|uniref:Glycogen synthase n=1 Tax=Cecembia lonarensis (strain CCUG 58316 / KCTC 22772 / LW9) TaxID=1225176 RepID=K1KYD0_CECL9|nr:glycosyltransferase [Cecembia lonarensis]EKB49140.1 Glycogen synthase [Cecembia lonarensis LW9]
MKIENIEIQDAETTKVVFLYREIMPYNIPVIIELVKLNAEILFVHDDVKKLTPYVPPILDGVEYFKKSDLNQRSLELLVHGFNPDIIYISDRTIAMYNKIGIVYNGKIPVISGNDTPWYGGKQWLNVVTSWFRHKRFFSHMLVAGIRQFEYAKKLGFANDKIIWPMYSADVKTFKQIPLGISRFEEAKDILFVGRFNKVKGINYLLDGWRQIENKNGAKLHLVGNGTYLDKLELPNDIVIHTFSNQEYLAELAFKCKAFILPSIFEPWGVVVHEFAAAGMPLIISDVCGASPHFLKNNYNGFSIKAHSSSDVQAALSKIFSLNPKQLSEMGKKSRELSQSISPKLVAAAILSTQK